MRLAAGRRARAPATFAGGLKRVVARQLLKLLERLDRPGVELASIW
jgi:hypothetical protein